MANEHLIVSGNAKIDLTKPFVLNWAAFSEGGGQMSDAILSGNYQLKTVHVKADPRKDGDGTTVTFTDKVIGPEGCSEVGKTLYTRHSIPAGDLNSAENRKNTFIMRRLWSAMTAKDPKVGEKLRALKERAYEKGIKGFETQEPFVKIKETTTKNGAPTAEIQSYISKEQYDESPGPFGGGNGAAASTVVAATSAPAAVEAPTASDPFLSGL